MAAGHIRKRETEKGESYQIIVEVESETDINNGKKRNRVYKTVYGTKKEAEKVMREMLSQIENKVFVKNNETTVKEFLQEWLKIYIIPSKSPTTSKGYEDNLKRYLYPTIGKKKLQDLKTVDIQKLYNELRKKSTTSDKPLSPKTVRNIHMNLSAALDKAVEQDVLQKNPAKSIDLPKISKYKAEVYNTDEIKELFELVKDTDLELAVNILVLLGLRRGELCALRFRHIDFEKKTLKVVENAVMVNSDVIFKDPKSESGKREISIPDSLIVLLKKSHEKYLAKKEKSRSKLEDFVLAQEDGNPYKPSSFSQKIRRFLNDSNMKKIRLHDFRHTNATLMLSLGISPKIAQQRLGHSDFSTTMDIYSHVLEDVEKEAVEKMDDVFSKARSKGKDR